MKRKVSIVLCIIMLCSIFSIIGMAEDTAAEAVGEIELGNTEIRLPAVEGTENLLKNGDLEELNENGKPVGWSSRAYDGENGVGASIVTGKEAYNGNSIKLVGGPIPANLPFISQNFVTQGGAIYQLRTMLRKDSGTSRMTVKLEFYPENLPGATTVWQVNTFMIPTTNGKWQETLYNFKAPITAKSVSIYLRLMNQDGEVCYYDEASVHMVRPAEMLEISPDQFFYYQEAEKGEATVSALTEFYPEAIGGSVDFAFTDGEKVLQSDTAPLDENGQAVFGYDTTLIKELKKEYVLRAILKDKNGNALYTKEETIYKYARPKYIREDGVYQVPGEEPFNVIPTYHAYQVNTADEFEELKNAGINVLQGNVNMLERAGNAGMKVLITLYNNRLSAGHADMREYTIEQVTKYKDDPRVYGWAVSDEPYLNLADPLPELKEAYKLIRDIDDNHPVYIVECVSKHLADTAKCCDVVAHDPYLGTEKGQYTGVKMNTSGIYNAALKTAAAANGIKPTLHLLQAFENIDYIPDADAERHMIYQSYMAGTMAHGYFAWDDAMVRDGKSIRLSEVTETNIYEGLTSFKEKEQDDVFRHFVTKEYPGFSHYVGEDVMYHGYIKDNKLYMIVMNQSTVEEKTFEIPLTSFDGSISIDRYNASYVCGFEGEAFRSSGALKATVPKHGVAVLEVVPSQKADFASLSKDAFWEYFKAVNENPDHSEGMNAHFTDIDEYDWAKEAIESLYREGVVNEKETGVFAPADKITRAEFAGFLVRTLGLTSDSTELFEDVTESHEFAKEIAIGKALGILKGTDGVNYNPEAEISRQDLMVICARGMRLVKELAEGEEPVFTDKEKIADYALSDVAAMVKAEIVTGYTDGTIGPLGNTTRAEAAVIMGRISAWKVQS